MQMRAPNSLPIGPHHLAKLLEQIQALEARVRQLENTTPAYLQLTEITTPAAGPTNTGRLFVVDNGSGKSSLRVLFPTGAVQTLATEP